MRAMCPDSCSSSLWSWRHNKTTLMHKQMHSPTRKLVPKQGSILALARTRNIQAISRTRRLQSINSSRLLIKNWDASRRSSMFRSSWHRRRVQELKQALVSKPRSWCRLTHNFPSIIKVPSAKHNRASFRAWEPRLKKSKSWAWKSTSSIKSIAHWKTLCQKFSDLMRISSSRLYSRWTLAKWTQWNWGHW